VFDDLYQELILDHSRRETNRGALGAGACHTHLRNPFCGDDIKLWVQFDGDRIRKVRFSGMGCLISQAAASMMAELAEGRTLEQVQQLSHDFRTLLDGRAHEDVHDRIGDLVALGGVRRVPARIRCALLAFEALERLVGEEIKSRTEGKEKDSV